MSRRAESKSAWLPGEHRAPRAVGSRARIVLLLLSWVWLTACGAPAPAGSVPATTAEIAPPAAPTSAPAALVTAAASAPGAQVAQPAPPPLSPTVKVRVGVTGIAPEAAIYQALEQGYFQDEGLDVELVPVRGITEQVGLLATGQLDFGNGGIDPGLFNAAQRDIGLKLVTAMVLSTEQNPGGAALLVRKDLVDSGQYQGLDDLKGLTIAVSALGTTSQSYLERALAQGGLTADDVNLVAMAFPDMLTALGNKAIDAAWGVEPFVAIANSRGIAQTMTKAGDVFPGAIGVVMVIGPQFAAEQPEAARRYVTAYLRAVRDYYRAFVSNENPAGREQFTQVLMKHTPVKDPALYPLMGWPGVDPNGGLDEGMLDEMQDYLLRKGTIREKTASERIVDHSYVAYALERLGRYPQ
ncbi:MAG TPA: ABC transporter substrate-binding protein [Chloroflexota bacterium]|nr:ABC transporter substrate-binding protein [Chloroflexota bacterium]